MIFPFKLIIKVHSYMVVALQRIQKDFLLVNITVFFVGATTMIVEILGVRLIAPIVGTSFFVWSALIGTILGSYSAGSYFGGVYSRRGKSNIGTIRRLLLVSGILIGLLPIEKLIIATLFPQLTSILLQTLILSIFLFLPLSALLGTIFPLCVQLKTRQGNLSGEAVGKLGALSALGSVAGVFLAGFVLIPLFTLSTILGVVAVMTIVLSVVFHASLTAVLEGGIALALMFLSMFVVEEGRNNLSNIQFETLYSSVSVYEKTDRATGRAIRTLRTGPYSTQASMFLDSEELVFGYLKKFLSLTKILQKSPTKALMIGGGGYSFPKAYISQFPHSFIDVVEIDPKMTEIAENYFRFDRDDRIRVIHEDGRVVLNSARATAFDVIYIDAFLGVDSIPFNLTTEEAVRRIHGSLRPGGLVMINTVTSLSGDQGRFLRAEYATYRQLFSQVFIFPLHSSDPYRTQSVILMAIKQSGRDIINTLPTLVQKQKPWKLPIDGDVPVLTDDYAPVEYYLSNTLTRLAQEKTGTTLSE